MNWKTLVLSVIVFDFLVLSAYAVGDVGYIGIFTGQFGDWGRLQVLVDLVIVCGLAMIWMVADARRRGTSPWPYLLVTLLAGSFGPLLYLLQREWRSHRQLQVARGAP